MRGGISHIHFGLDINRDSPQFAQELDTGTFRGLSKCRLRFWYSDENLVSYLLVVQLANAPLRVISRPNECLKIHYGEARTHCRNDIAFR